jgi:hypothetical protein
MSEAGCGDCSLCCRLLEVQEIDKPFLKMCQHAQRGAGCTIYASRPESCRAFVCTWLASQQAPDGAAWDRMPPEMRPDRCHVVFARSTASTPTIACTSMSIRSVRTRGSAATSSAGSSASSGAALPSS